MPQFDGAAGAVNYRKWPAHDARAVAVFVHGVGEHSGLYDRFAARLNAHGISVLALDQIGHGLTAGNRGQIDSLEDLVLDVLSLTQIAADAHPAVDIVLIGHSLGGIVAAVVAGRYPDRYAGLVLSGTTLSAPAGWSDGDEPEGTVEDDFDMDSAALSADPWYLAAMANDPLVFSGGAEMARSLRRVLPPAWEELVGRLPDLSLPILIVHGENDEVSPFAAAQRSAQSLTNAEVLGFTGGKHDVLNDTVHESVAEAIAEFVNSLVSPGAGS
jgi:alpha-beta hydrolase superfamily lysophospholipase